MKKFTKTELKEALSYDTQESYIAIPNNIFELLSGNKDIMSVKAPHAAVIYSYVYLNTWLYRYAKYGKIPEELTTTEGIKTILGLSPKCREYNYAFKKNGVLEQLGLLQTKPYYEAPIDWVLCGGEPEFVLLDDVDVVDMNVRRKQIKYPVFALEDRVVNGKECEGTFFDPRYTHTVPFEVFIECMTNPELGCTAFYLYSYLHSRCQMNDGTVEVSVETISKKTGINHNSRDKALNALKKFGLVNVVSASTFVIGGKSGHANVYSTVLDDSEFTSTPKEYNKGSVVYATQIHEEPVTFVQQPPVETVTIPSSDNFEEKQVSDKYDSLMDIENLIQHELGA